MRIAMRWIGACLLLAVTHQAQAATQFSSADYALYPGDFNNDGRSDLLFIGKTPDKPSGIALADSSGHPQFGFQTWPSNYLNIPWSDGTYAAVVADFNGDGYSDVLLQRQTAGNHYLLFANTNTDLAPTGQILGINQTIGQTSFGIAWSADQHRLVAGNFDGVGGADLFFQATAKGGTNAIVLSDSNGLFYGNSTNHCWSGGPQQCWTDGYQGFQWSTRSSIVYAANFGGDAKADLLVQGRPDIVLIDYEIPIPVPRFRPQSFGILTAQAIDGAGTIFRSTADLWNWNERGGNWSPLNTNLVIGDFDGDGYADIFLQSKSAGRPNVLVKENASGTGQVQTAVSLASNVAGWTGSNYQLLSGRFGNSASAVLYLQATTAGGSNYYTSNVLGAAVSTVSSSLKIVPAQPVTPTAVGATAGTASVSATGTAGYSIPIQVPRGTADLTPKLALSYSHSTGNGLYGIGWGLSGLSIITRCPKTLAQDGVTQGVQLAVDDEYCLDGNRLRRVTTTPGQGQDGSQYRTELETYSLVTAKGAGTNGPSWFEVKTKDGLIYEYGHSTDSRIPVPGSTTTRVWALSRIRDRAGNTGNYIEFTYYNDTANGSYRPQTIKYTGNADLAVAPPYTIEFFDEARNAGENVVNYYMGGLVNQTRRVNRIEVRYGATVVRKYLLGYGAAPTASAFSRLSSIQECGVTNCLPETQLTWSDQQLNGSGLPALDTTARPAPNYQQIPSEAGFRASLDFNGDGVIDTLTAGYPPYGNSLTINLGARHGEAAPAALVYYPRYPTDGSFGPYDWDADGKDDVLVGDAGTSTYWWLHHTSDGTIVYEDTGASFGGNSQTLMDVDGDGYKDIIRIDVIASRVYVRFHLRNSAVGFEAAETLAWTAPSGTTIAYPTVGGQQWFEKATRSILTNADVDGDGRQDILVQVNNGWRVLYSSGTGFATGDLIVSKLQDASMGYVQPTALDVNGDGCTDLAYPSNVASPILQLAVSRCRFSGGVGLQAATSTGITVAPNGFSAVVVDWNLDGYHDLMFEGKIVTSLGTSLATPVADGSAVGDARADLDGDGIPDLAVSCGCSSGTYTFYAGLGPKPNLLLSVTDGLDNKTSFSYAPLTDPNVYTRGTGGAGPNQDLNGAMYVVKQMQSTDGTGGAYTLSYKYEQARRNIRGRGFLGFAKRTITDGRTGMVTQETHDQSITASGENWEKVGRLTSRKVYQSAGGLVVQDATYVISSFAPTDSPNGRYPYVSQSQVKDYELNNGVDPIKTVTTTTTVDNYGTAYDVQTTILEGATGLFTGSTATQRTYTPPANIINNLPNWCLSKPTQVQSIRSHTQANGGPLTRTMTQTWDTADCRLTDAVAEPGALQLATHFDYDGFSNVTKTTLTGSGLPPAGLVTETYWGTSGQLPQWTKNPKQQQTSFTWDYSLGLKLTETDPNGRPTTNSYDEFGRVIRVQRPDGTSTRQSFFACNAANSFCGDSLLRMMVKTAERDAGDTTDVSYRYVYLDALGRKKYEQQLAFNGGLSVVQTMYDPRGNVASQSMPYYANTGAYNGISYIYDLLNRVIRTDRPTSDANPTLQTEYVNYNGLTVTQVDANGGAQTQVSNAWGQVVHMVDQAGAATDYTYNAFGELRTVADPLGNVSSVTYNARGFKDTQNDPDLGQWIYTYDALGQMLTQRDAKLQTTSFTYDELGRMKTRTDPGLPVTTWNWDTAANGIGQLGSVNAPDGSGQLDATHFYRETYAYDSVGRRSTVTTQETAIGSYTIDYSYDASLGTLKTITYPTSTSGRFAVQYNYQNGYLKDAREATPSAPLLWQALEQNARGHVIQESYGNGQQTYLNFDETNGRLNYLQTGPSGGSATQNLVYQWDRVGNLVSRRDASQSVTESFLYDAVHRLTETRLNGSIAQTMAYDAIGNITSKVTPAESLTYAYPASGPGSVRPHAVSTVGGTSYAYDANGNMTSRAGATVVWTSYNYPQTINETGGNYSTFYYAPDRSKYRQVAKTGATTEDRVYIGGMFEKTTSGSTTEYRHYIVANGKAVAVRKRVGATDETYYLHEDHLGSTDAITNAAGAVFLRLSYGAWGDRRGSNWTGAPSAADIAALNATTHRGFTKQEQLDNLSLVHLNGRVYDPVIGRFMSADPIIQDPYHSQSFNRYSYVWNNPLNATDPTGFACTGSRIGSATCEDTGAAVIPGPAFQPEKEVPRARQSIERPQASDSGNNSAQEGPNVRAFLAERSPNRNSSQSEDTVIETPNSAYGDLSDSIVPVARQLRGRGSNSSRTGQRAAPRNGPASQRFIPGGRLEVNDQFPGAHVRSRHVGLTPSQLRQRMREENLKRASSFRNKEEAESMIGEALAQAPIARLNAANGDFVTIRVELGRSTGVSVQTVPTPNGGATTRTTEPTGVRIVLQPHPGSDTGYYIRTAFPE